MLVSHGFTSFSEVVFADLLTVDSGTPNSCHLVQLGASWAPLVSSGQVWRLVVPWVFRETSSEMGLELVEMVHVPYVFLSFTYCASGTWEGGESASVTPNSLLGLDSGGLETPKYVYI